MSKPACPVGVATDTGDSFIADNPQTRRSRLNHTKRRRDSNDGGRSNNGRSNRPLLFRSNAFNAGTPTTDGDSGAQSARPLAVHNNKNRSSLENVNPSYYPPKAIPAAPAFNKVASKTSATNNVPDKRRSSTQHSHSNHSYKLPAHHAISSHPSQHVHHGEQSFTSTEMVPVSRNNAVSPVFTSGHPSSVYRFKPINVAAREPSIRVVTPVEEVVDESLLLPPHDFDYAQSKAKMLIKSTTGRLDKDGHGPITNAEHNCISNIEETAIYFLELAHPIIIKEYCKYNGMFLLRYMSKDLGKLLLNYRLLVSKGRCEDNTRDQWKTGCVNSVTKGGIGRVLEQLKERLTEEEFATLDLDQYVRVYLVLDELKKLLEDHPQLKEVAMKLVRIAPSSQTHKDHTGGLAYDEVVNYLGEFCFASMFPGVPGYVLEKLLDLGSVGLRTALMLPSPSANADAIEQLTGVKKFRPLLTWTTYISALMDYIEKLKKSGADDKTIHALEAMLRDSPEDGFLQWNMTLRLLANGEEVEIAPFVDAVPESSPFEAVKLAAIGIIATVDSADSPATKKERVQYAISTIDDNTPHAVRYVAPSEVKLKGGCERAFHGMVDTASASSSSKELIICERSLKDSLSPETKLQYFPERENKLILDDDGNIAADLWELPCSVDGKEIFVLVVPSWHVIWGQDNTILQRLRNGQAFLTVMSVLEAAHIVPHGSTEKERKIMLASFMMWEGYSGNLPEEQVDGSFYKARRIATPNGYFSRPTLPGVRALGNVLSPRAGINDMHVPALMAVMGYDCFERMLNEVFDTTVDESDFTAFLARLKKEQESERSREYYAVNAEVIGERAKQRYEASLSDEQLAAKKQRDHIKAIRAKKECERTATETKALEEYDAANIEAARERAEERRAKLKKYLEGIRAKKEWERTDEETEALEEDEAVRQKKSSAQKKWSAANPDYWKVYRGANSEHTRAQKKEYLAKKAGFQSGAEHDAAKNKRAIEVRQRLERLKQAQPRK